MFSLSKSYQEVKDNLDTLFNQVEENNTVLVISRDGHEDVAVIKAKELSSLLESIHLLRSSAHLNQIKIFLKTTKKLLAIILVIFY